ncbi:MAG: hypothetical protein ACPG7F_02270 [Aggregatilineales bacterium]
MQAGSIRNFIGANPVSIAEFRYQRFVIKRGKVGGLWILLAAAMVVPALITAFVLTVVMLFADPLLPIIFETLQTFDESTAQTLTGIGNLLVTSLLISNLALYPVVTLVTMSLSANSIRREKHGFTWDTLRLTEIGAWRIVTGKWRASLQALNGDHIMMTLLRSGLLAVYLLFNYVLVIASTPDISAPPMGYSLAMLILLILTLIYGALDAALTAALGIPGMLPDETAGTIMGALTMSLRIAAGAGAVTWTALSVHVMIYHGFAAIGLLSIIGIMTYLLLITGALLLARWLVK